MNDMAKTLAAVSVVPEVVSGVSVVGTMLSVVLPGWERCEFVSGEGFSGGERVCSLQQELERKSRPTR